MCRMNLHETAANLQIGTAAQQVKPAELNDRVPVEYDTHPN